jgi:hypothetical protein
MFLSNSAFSDSGANAAFFCQTPVLLKLAFAWEQNTGPRPKPKFLARS